MRLVTLASTLLLVTACTSGLGRARSPALAAQERTRLVVGDTFSTPAEEGLQTTLARLSLRTTDGATRQLPFFIAEYYSRPILVADSIVIVVGFDSAGTRLGLMRYHVRRGVADTLALPPDLAENVTDVSIAPDGSRMAYVAFPGDYTGHGVVRRIPSGPIELRTPAVAVEGTDVLIGSAEWLSARSVRFWIAFAEGSPNQWIRFQGTLGSSRLAIDTVLADTLLGRRGK